MKTRNLLTIALAVAMLVMPLGIIQSARAAKPRETPLIVTVDLPVYYTSATIGSEPYPVHVGPDDKSVKIGDVTYTVDGTNLKDSDGNVAGTLSGGRQEVKTEGDVPVKVTLSGTKEPVNNATVSWAGLEGTTDAFGGFTFTAPFRESEKKYGPVEAIKVYQQESIERSAYGASAYDIVVVPYDLSNPEEFLAWWGHFALTAEAQAMYTASEILGDWGANLGTEGVTVWSNIFGPKGGSLAKFIKGFPQFMVDRGAAIEATKNMLSTIWALFTLLPAFVLALPQLLQTAPMRMLQFWPTLFINLDIVLGGISQMVIDLGVFMTSLAPSVLLLLPQIFEKLPNIAPNAMNIVLTAVQLFVQMIPALSQYLPAAIAAIPAFFVQMLQALFYNAPAIFSTVMGETFKTVKNLFRSWPLFPAGIAAGILAVAPALMMLPAMAPLVLMGRTLENTAGALGSWMQSMRAAPSQLLEPILHALGTNPATLGLRYVFVLGYCLVTSFLFAPAILIAMFALWVAITPLILLTLSLALAPLFAALMFVPVIGWIWDIIWAGWMAVSTLAALAVTVPSTCMDILDYTANRVFQVLTIPGYAVGWFLQGIIDVLSINLLSRLQGLISRLMTQLPQIIAYIQPLIKALMNGGATAGTVAMSGGSSGLLGLLGTIGPFIAGMTAGGAGGAMLGAAGGATATGAVAAVTPL
jgi:hypothetical protein